MMKCFGLLLLFAVLNVFRAPGQDYGAGEVHGTVRRSPGPGHGCEDSRQLRSFPEATVRATNSILPVTSQETTTKKKAVNAVIDEVLFHIPALQVGHGPWKFNVVHPSYQPYKKQKPAYANPQPNVDKNIRIDSYICMEDKPSPTLPRRSPDGFFGQHGFGTYEQPSDQPGSPSPEALSGRITTEAGGRATGIVKLYGIRYNDAHMFRLDRVSSTADGNFHISLGTIMNAGYDQFYVLARGQHATEFSALIGPDELGNPLEMRLAPPPPPDNVPGTPDPARGIMFGQELMRSLPLAGARNVDQLLLLAGGVFPGPEAVDLSGPGISAGIGTSGELSVNGQRARQNNFVLDGADNTDEGTGVRRQGFVFSSPVPVETVINLQAMTGSADVRFGRASGAQINVLSASGSNAFHGTLYGYLTDRRLNARNFFDSRPSSQPVSLAPVTFNGRPLELANPVDRDPPLTRTQAGFTFGGPLSTGESRDPATFFFAAFENQRTRSASESHFSVPTVRQRGFKNLGDTGLTGSDGSSLYPASLAGDAIFSLYPFPNQPGGPFGANTYAEVLPADSDGRLFSLKLDRYLHVLRAGHILTVRYGRITESSDLASTGAALFSSAIARVRNQSVAAIFHTNLARLWASSARFGWGRAAYVFDERRSPLQLPSSLFPSEPFLLNRPLLLNVTTIGGPPAFVSTPLPQNPAVGTNSQTEQYTGAIGRVNVPGFSSIGADTFHFPQRSSSDTFQWAETATRVTGRHSLSVGFEVWRLGLISTLERNRRPELTFSGQVLQEPPPAFPGAPPPAVTGRLDPTSVIAAGLVPSFQQTLAISPDRPLRLSRKQIDFFFQEDWRVFPRVTVSVGGRFQMMRLPGSDDGRFERAPNPALFDPSICDGRGPATPDCRVSVRNLFDAFPAGFQKAFNASSFTADFRAGIAWAPFGPGTSPLRFSIGKHTGRLPAAITEESRDPFPPPTNTAPPPCNCGIAAPFASILNPSTLNLLNSIAAMNPVAALALTPGTNVQLVQPGFNLQPPSVMQFNLGIQHRLPGDSVVSFAYVGAIGQGLLRVRDEGAFALPGFAISAIIPAAGRIPDFVSVRAPQFAAGSVSKLLFESKAESRFHSLQGEFRGAVKHWLQFGAALTWAHSADDASDFFDTAGSFALPQNNTTPSERGPSSFDVRVRGTGYFVWDVPRLLKGPLLNGWQLAGIVTAQTGQPFTVNTAFDVNGDGLLTDRLATTTGLLGPAVGRSISGASRTTLLALAPGVSPASLLATKGDGAVGRNSFRAGGMASIDLALSKTFAFRERYRLAWRVESFNSANRSNFGVPVRILEAPAFGQAFRTVTPNRTLQIGGTFDF